MESTRNFLMRRESCRRSFQFTLAKPQRIDRISAQHSDHRIVHRQIAGQGQIADSLQDDDISVNGRSLRSLPLDVNLLFIPANKYADERRELGRLEYRESAQHDAPDGMHAATLTLELALPMELAPRFMGDDRTPLITVAITGLDGPGVDAPPGMGSHNWNASVNGSLVVDECIVADPASDHAQEGTSPRERLRATQVAVERIDARLSELARTLGRSTSRLGWSALALLAAMLLVLIIRS